MRTHMMLHRKKIFFLGAVLMIGIMCSLPHASFAQATTQTPTFVPLASYAKSAQFNAVIQSGSLPEYINNVFKIVLSVGAILAVLRIAYAGYMYMGAADMWGNKQHAREILGDAIIGLLLLFSIYLILNLIDPNLLNLNIVKDITPLTTCQSANCTGVNG